MTDTQHQWTAKAVLFFMRRFTFPVTEGQKAHICLPDMNLPDSFYGQTVNKNAVPHMERRFLTILLLLLRIRNRKGYIGFKRRNESARRSCAHGEAIIACFLRRIGKMPVNPAICAGLFSCIRSPRLSAI